MESIALEDSGISVSTRILNGISEDKQEYNSVASKVGCSKQAPSVIMEKRDAINIDEKIKVETDAETTELLGSVTTQNCPGTRTSARVIQKMKQDQTRPITPPPSEREHKKEEKNVQKTPSQVRTNKSSWSNLERNYFFDAINEFGKDFDSIGNYINTKLKRKSATDVSFKTKDQVRQHYYQTFHKICKYIKFSEEIKKPAQELYALINYGEMRRKLQFVTDKHYMKLRNLVYQGYITVRCKGKNIRIKTPSCKALRRLNQLDDSLEDIRLPSKIEVIVSPANMEAFGRVQTIAQNPCVRTTVPLHKKLVNFIKAFQYKWRSSDVKLAEVEAKVLVQPHDNTTNNNESLESRLDKFCRDPEMCFLPKPGVTIHRPLLSITEYLSSMNICLTAYEERMGIKVRSESLNFDRTINKRQRTDSDSDKRSPDTKKLKVSASVVLDRSGTQVVGAETNESETSHSKSESSGDELNDEMNELLGDAENFIKEEMQQALECVIIKNEPNIPLSINAQTQSGNNQTIVRAKRNTGGKSARASLTFKPLVSEEVIRCIRKGWTVSNAADITIGDLYVVFGQDSRLELNYYWTENYRASSELAVNNTENFASATNTSSSSLMSESNCAIFAQKQNGMPYNPNECDDPHLLKSISSAAVANKLKHLLLIANLSERIRKRQCSCGHTCSNATKTRIDRDFATKTFISPKTYRSGASVETNALFRQPIAPMRRQIVNMDPVKQLTTLTRAKMSRQVLVQRVLLPGAVTNVSNDARRETLTNSSVLRTPASGNKLNSHTSAKAVLNTSSSTICENSVVPSNFSSIIGESIVSTASADPAHSYDVHTQNMDAVDEYEQQNTNDTMLHSSSLVPESPFDDISLSNSSLFNSLSPMHLLRESTSNSRWLEENLNDFSLTSLLGHLDEINAGRDILDPSSNLSMISESSVDFRHKFQEITASMQNQDKDNNISHLK